MYASHATSIPGPAASRMTRTWSAFARIPASPSAGPAGKRPLTVVYPAATYPRTSAATRSAPTGWSAEA